MPNPMPDKNWRHVPGTGGGEGTRPETTACPEAGKQNKRMEKGEVLLHVVRVYAAPLDALNEKRGPVVTDVYCASRNTRVLIYFPNMKNTRPRFELELEFEHFNISVPYDTYVLLYICCIYVV